MPTALMVLDEVDPPDFTATPFWRSFWIACGLIMVIVILVGATIGLATRIEQQATETQGHLVAGKYASAPFEDLVEANVYLRMLARAARATPGRGTGSRR